MTGITTRRVARKAHRCECYRLIKPGYVYLEHVGFPDDVLDTITRLRECAPCAKRYGRTDLLGDIPLMGSSCTGRAWHDRRPHP